MLGVVPALLVAAGCGGSGGSGATATATTAQAKADTGLSSRPVRYAGAGIAFRPPQRWTLRRGRAPLVAVAQAGVATVAVWRYPRSEQLPTTHPALVAAKQALVGQILRRDRTFRLWQAKLLHVGPQRAVQVLGVGTLGDARRQIRSTHVYAEHSEYVIDGSAPLGVFRRVDTTVFVPLLHSVRITRPGSGR